MTALQDADGAGWGAGKGAARLLRKEESVEWRRENGGRRRGKDGGHGPRSPLDSWRGWKPHPPMGESGRGRSGDRRAKHRWGRESVRGE